MRHSTLDRRLVRAVLVLFVVPTLAVGAILVVLYRQGVYDDNPAALVLTAAVGFVTMMAYLATVAHTLGRSLVRTLQEIRLGTELVATVNPDHRLEVRTGDELEVLAEEINRMADRVREARRGLADEVARATRDLAAEREALARVLEALGEGAVLATPDGRVSLANRAAQALLGGGLLGGNLFDVVDREKIALFLGRLRAGGSRAERFTLHPAGGGVLDTVMTPLGDGEGRVIGFILLLRDVTRPVHADEARRRLVGDALREIRDPMASIRSLSETLLGDSALAGGPAVRLIEAIHAEALRLSRLLRRLDEPGPLGLVHPPWQLEEVSVADLTAMVRRRLEQEGAGPLAIHDGGALPPIRAEASALSGALAGLARAVLARRAPGGGAWLRPAGRGRVVQIEVSAEGRAAVTDLDPHLDAPPEGAPPGRRPVREVVRQHAGEVWAYADADRLGFRITLPAAEPGPSVAPGGEPTAASGGTFVGAGTVSGVEEDREAPERPEFYDFSLFEQVAHDLAPDVRDRPLGDLAFVAFDTETTGLRPDEGDRIVSIAGVRIRGGAVRRGETFDALVNPGRPVPPASVRFHGITDAMVGDAPPLDVVLPAFLRFTEGAVLVGHEVSFDLHCLAIETRRLGLPPIPATRGVLDTLLLSEALHGPLAGHGLDRVARRLGVVVRGRHSALGDALATAEVFVRLVELLERRGIRTLGEATDAMRRARRGAEGPNA